MKAKELIEQLKHYPNHEVRLLYADYTGCCYEQPLPTYKEMSVVGINFNLTTETLKTVYLNYEEV